MAQTASVKAETHEQSSKNIGTILRVSGTIIDVQFHRDHAPAIFNELKIQLPAENNYAAREASLEVEQQLGDGVVRCIALENIFGIRRGLSVIDTGSPIKVPVGKVTLGRVFDVLGRTIDGKAQVEGGERWSIYRPAPQFIEQKIEDTIQETGI